MKLLKGYNNKSGSYVWYNYQQVLYGYSHKKQKLVFDGDILDTQFYLAVSNGVLKIRDKYEIT